MMKTLRALLVIALFTAASHAQDVTGTITIKNFVATLYVSHAE